MIGRLGRRPGRLGFHVPARDKLEWLTRGVHGGPLPRKTFSMGKAHEKRHCVEARWIR